MPSTASRSGLRARISAPVAPSDPFTLTFDSIKNTPGTFQNRDGRVLVVFANNSDGGLVSCSHNRTGLTRTNMFMIDTNGSIRSVNCDRNPDGKKNWMKYTGPVTIQTGR